MGNIPAKSQHTIIKQRRVVLQHSRIPFAGVLVPGFPFYGVFAAVIQIAGFNPQRFALHHERVPRAAFEVKLGLEVVIRGELFFTGQILFAAINADIALIC